MSTTLPTELPRRCSDHNGPHWQHSATQRPHENVLDLVGSTPLVRLDRYLDEVDVRLYAKLEMMNPGGSAKDRPAAKMLQEAMQSGVVDQNTIVIESSSGNMGIGLAQACRYHDLPFICVADPHAQAQNLAIIRALGAKIDLVTQPVDGSFLTARLCRVEELLNSHARAFWPNQYANRNNPASHEAGTMREIDEALGGDINYLFVATSSTGTIQGCRDYIRRRGLPTKVVAVDSTGSVLFGGELSKRHIPGLGAGTVPQLAIGQSFDKLNRMSDADCVVGCRRAAHREALLVGGSAGGVLETVRLMQQDLIGSTCAAILHDSGTRYLDTVFDDTWVEKTLDLSREQIEHRMSSLPATNTIGIA